MAYFKKRWRKSYEHPKYNGGNKVVDRSFTTKSTTATAKLEVKNANRSIKKSVRLRAKLNLRKQIESICI